MTRPLLLGLDNPHSADPRAALLPRPRGSAGYRLFEMSGMSWSRYRAAFERANVVDVQLGGRRLRNRVVVVLGRTAWRRLRMRDVEYFASHWAVDLCSTFILVPHTSGRCRMYNDVMVRRRLTFLLNKLAIGVGYEKV